jgi:hypothetical protein
MDLAHHRGILPSRPRAVLYPGKAACDAATPGYEDDLLEYPWKVVYQAVVWPVKVYPNRPPVLFSH